MADSFDLLYGLNATTFGDVGLSLTHDDYRDLFQVNVHSRLKELVPAEKYAAFLDSKKRHFGPTYEKVALFDFAPDLIRRLSQVGNLIVVSSTPAAFLEKLLKKHGLESFFTKIFGSESMSKASEIEEGLKLLKATPIDAFFVTDTEGDLAVGQKLGLQTIAVTWGFHPSDRLAEKNPTKLIGEPEELLRFFETLPTGTKHDPIPSR